MHAFLKKPVLPLKEIILLASLLFSACAITPLPQPAEIDPGATLQLYLQPLPQEAYRLSIEVTGLAARTVDGRDIPLLTAAWLLQPGERSDRQTRLLQKKLPVGEYQGLSLQLGTATLQTEEGPVDLLIAEKTRLIPQKFLISPGQIETLFLTLHPERLVTGGYRLTAQFSLWKARSPLPKLQGLVSLPNHGVVTVFEKSVPTIVRAIAGGSQPAGIALDQNQRLAYLALRGDDSIAVFDLNHDQLQRKIRLHSGAAPTDLALSSDGRSLVCLNSGTRSVSIISTDSGNERWRLLFPTAPAAIFTGGNQARAYVSLPGTNSLALLDLDRGAVLSSVNLSDTPGRGVVDRSGRQLYLLTEDSPDLLLVAADSLNISRRVHIGYGARCIALDRNNGRLYVGMQSGEIAVIDPRIGLPIDSLTAPGAVIELVPDREENSLFVITGGENLLSQYDLVSKKQLAVLELGAAGYGLAVMGEK